MVLRCQCWKHFENEGESMSVRALGGFQDLVVVVNKRWWECEIYEASLIQSPPRLLHSGSKFGLCDVKSCGIRINRSESISLVHTRFARWSTCIAHCCNLQAQLGCTSCSSVSSLLPYSIGTTYIYLHTSHITKMR